MASCNFKAPNGQPSLLYIQLEQALGEDKAIRAWAYTKTKTFQELKKVSLDANGEPQAEWLMKHLGLTLPKVVRNFPANTTPTAPDGSPSPLYSVLAEAHGEAVARATMNYLYSKEFGDAYMDGYTMDEYIEMAKGWALDSGLSLAETLRQTFPDNFKIEANEAGEPSLQWLTDNNLIQPAPAAPSVEASTEEDETVAGKLKLKADGKYYEGEVFGSAKKKEDRISYEEALKAVRKLYTMAMANPNKSFDLSSLSAVGINKASRISGYTPIEMANILASLERPSNVKFSDEFEQLIKNTASEMMKDIQAREVPMLMYDSAKVENARDEWFIPILDENGRPTGQHFTPEQQVAAVDSIVSIVWRVYENRMANKLPTDDIDAMQLLDPDGHVMDQLRQWVRKHEKKLKLDPNLSEEGRLARIENTKNVINSYERIARAAVDRLEAYGIRIRGNKEAVLERMFHQDSELQAESITEGLEGNKGGEAWFDSSFERDPADSASERVKLFLASIRDAEVGMEDMPPRKPLFFARQEVRDRLLGKAAGAPQTMTIRTADDVSKLGLVKGVDYVTEVDGVPMRFTPTRQIVADDLVNNPELLYTAQEEGVTPQIGDWIVSIKKYSPIPNKVKPKLNFMGFPTLVDYEDLFQELLEITSGVTLLPSQHKNVYDAMVKAIQAEASTFRPTLSVVVTQLERQEDQLKREFATVMAKQYQEFTILLHSKDKSGFRKIATLNANSGSAVQSVLEQWRENQKHGTIVKEDVSGHLVINREVADQFKTELDAINVRIKEQSVTVEELRDFASRLLEANGVLMPTSAMDYLFNPAEDGFSKVTKNTTVSGNMAHQFGYNEKNGKPHGIFSIMVDKLTGATTEEDTEYLLNNNPLHTEKNVMRILARLAYRFSPRVASGSHRNSEGKSIYSFGAKTHLSDTLGRLKTDESFLGQLMTTHAGKNNWLVKGLWHKTIPSDQLGLQYVDGLKASDSRNSEGVVRPQMSPREQLLFAISQYTNNGAATMNMVSLTHSDKTTTPMYTDLPRFQIHEMKMEGPAKTAVYETFLGELERIQDWQKTKDNGKQFKNDSYAKGGGLFYLMPFLNYDYMRMLEKRGTISQDQRRMLWDDNGKIVSADAITRTPKLSGFVLKMFNQYLLKQEANALYAQFKEEGFIEGKLFDINYVKNALPHVGLESKWERGKTVFEKFNGDRVTAEEAADAIAQHIAMEYTLNYFLTNAAMMGIAFGDPTLNYKPGRSSQFDFEKVEDSMKEYQKRLAKDIAPGHEPAWDSVGETYRAITLRDDERVHPYLDALHKYMGGEINGTDAQEYTTVREHLYVMKAMGKISGTVFDEMVKIIDAGLKTADKYYEFTNPVHKAVVMQIMKPVSVSHNFNEVEGLSTLQYIKSSSMPLYPPALRDMQLDKLRQVMEGDGTPATHIPRANYISAKKEGAPLGKGVSIFDADGNVTINPEAAEWKNAIQTLQRSGFRIQQEVPYEETKEAILLGSQENKLITQGITNMRGFVVRGYDGTIDGATLKQMKEDTRKKLVERQLRAFQQEMGINPDAPLGQPANKEALLRIMTDEATKRGYPMNDVVMLSRRIDKMVADGTTVSDLAIPLFFNPSADRFESLLMSLIKARIGKLKFPGKSFIQASSAGFRFTNSGTWEDLSSSTRESIVWVKGRDGKPLFDGKELKTMTRDASMGVQAAQVLIPFNFLVNDNLVDMQDFLVKDEKGRSFIDTERVPHELLEIIGFRIPTQKHNSMLAIEVVGFLPRNMGDTIIVPAAITKQMGSDFDVDKLYTYRRPYSYNEKTGRFTPYKDSKTKPGRDQAHFEELRDQAVREVPDDPTVDATVREQAIHERLNQLLEEAGKPTHEEKIGENDLNDDQLLTRYFDIQWSILTHGEMYETVMSPLDKPDLKVEADRVRSQRKAAAGDKVPVLKPFLSAKRQLDDFMSQKDAKVMVGISSLAVVFQAIIEDKQLRVGQWIELEDNQNEEDFGATERAGNKVFVPGGIKFKLEGQNNVKQAYHLSGEGTSKYYFYTDPETEELKPADVEQRHIDGQLQWALVDPFTGATIDLVSEATVEERTKLDQLTSLQSEFLDHAKNRTIDELNINLITIRSALAMAAMSSNDGSGLSAKHIALFLRQPALVNLVKLLSRSSDSLSSGFNPNALAELAGGLIKDYTTKAIEAGAAVTPETISEYLKENHYDVVDVTDLKRNLEKEEEAMTPTEKQDFYLSQIGTLQTFMALDAIGKELAMIQKNLNQDPRGPGKDMLSVLDAISKRHDVINNALIDGADALYQTEQGYIHHAELDTAADAYSEILPYSSISPIIDAITETTGREKLRVEDQKGIVESYKSFIFASPELGLSDRPNTDRFRLTYGTQTEQSLAHRVWEAQNTWGSDNYFLTRLQPKMAEVPNTPSYVFYLASRSSVLDDQANTAAFLDLLTSTDETQRKLAEDLVRYAYLTGGVSGGFSFIRYIPVDYLTALPFASELRRFHEEMVAVRAQNRDSFVLQWIQHNPSMMPKITLEMFGDTRDHIAEFVELPAIGVESKAGAFGPLMRFNKATNTTSYPEYISYFDKDEGKWKLFRKDGVRTFKRIDTLGDSYISEYNPQVGLNRSIMTQNRTLFKYEFGPKIDMLWGNTGPVLPVSKNLAEAYNLEMNKTLAPYQTTNLLHRVRDDKAQPGSQRIVAGILSEIVYAMKDSDPIETRIVTEHDLHSHTSAEDAVVIDMRDAGNSRARFGEILNHEIMHKLLFKFTYNDIEKLRAQYPSAVAAYEHLVASYEEARRSVLADFAAAGYDEAAAFELMEAQATTGRVPKGMETLGRMLYAVSSRDEYFAQILTKEEFQNYLNEKKSDLSDESFLTKFLAKLAEFLKDLAKDLGIRVSEGSQLETGLKAAFRVLEEVSSMEDIAPSVGPELRAIVNDVIGRKTMFKSEQDAIEMAHKLNHHIRAVHAAVEPTVGGAFKLVITARDKYGFDMESLFNLDEIEEVTNPTDKVFGKIHEQIAEIRSALRGEKTPQRLRQEQLLANLKALAADLKTTGDLDKIPAIAEYELNWAKTIADQYQKGLGPDVNEIMTAYRLTSLWKDIHDLVYAGATDGQFSSTSDAMGKVQKEAQDLYRYFTDTVMKNVMKEIASEQLKDEDFTTELTDMNQAEAKFLSVERAKAKLIQEVALMLQNTNRNYYEDGERLVKRIGKFEKKLKATARTRGMKVEKLYEMMFQDGEHWGMVSRYSSAFYRWKSGLMTKLKNKLDTIESSTDDSRTKEAEMAAAYAKYWKALGEGATHIDIRVLFDGAGEAKTSKGAENLRQRLVEAYGQELATELMDEAQEKLKKYIADKTDTKNMLATEVAEGRMTQEQADDAQGQWELSHSPFHRLSTKNGMVSTAAASLSDHYLVLAPLPDGKSKQGESFFDESYAKIKADATLMELYQELQDFMNEFRSNLPYYVDDKLGANFLPAIKAQMVSDISNVPEYIRSMPKRLIDRLTATSYEEYMQTRPRKEIPIMHIEDPLKMIPKPEKGASQDEWDAYRQAKADALKGYTKNLPRILELFGLMSLHYKHFSDAKASIDLGHEMLKVADAEMRGGKRQVQVNGRKETQHGNLENALGAVQYAIDALMYKQTKRLEQKFGETFRKTDKDKYEHTVKELKKRTYEAQQKLKKGEMTDEEYDAEMASINAELKRFEHRKFYVSKAGDFLITWTQLKALSYNPVSAFANLSFGLISSAIHANGNEDFGWKEFGRAFSIMMNSTGKSMRLTKLTGNDSNVSMVSRKVLAIMERMGIMGELTDGEYGESNLKHKEGGLKQTLSPYQMMRTGDYFAKGLNTIAVLLKEKVTVDGKEMSVWDALDEEGKFKYTEHPDAYKYYSEDVGAQTEWRRLRNKAIAVNKIIMGNQDKSSPIWAKKSILWRLMGQFRLSWLAEGVATRFEDEKYDTQLGRTRKGRYRTYADLGLLGSLGVMSRQVLSAIPGVNLDPYASATNRKTGGPLAEVDKANMRRNLAELGWFLLLFGTVQMIAAAIPDDDEEKKKRYKFFMNLAIRNYQDVALYANETTFDQILGSPAPALSTIRDLRQLGNATFKLVADDDYEAEQWMLKLTKAGIIPQTTLINRFKTMTERDLSAISR